MAYSRRPSRTPRSRFTLGLLLLTAVSVLVLDLPGTGPLDPVRGAFAAIFRPVRAAGDAVFEPLSNGWKGAFGYKDVKDENDELRKKLEDKKGHEAELVKLRAEVAELRKLNKIKVKGVPTVAAEIVTGPISSFEQTIEIDVGSGDGVKKGMAVVTGGGLFGQVTKVHGGRSTVQLITESDVSVGVSTKKGDLGLAHGQGQGKPLVIENFPDTVKVKVGDFIYTSGIDRSAFPKDLAVGRVSKVGKSVDGLPRVIEVEPTADFTARYVKVAKREPPS